MRHLLLVSHGTFAPGLHSVLKMLLGDREDVLSTSLEDGMGADAYIENLNATLAPVGPEDELVVLADILGGSPLTNALNVIAEKGLLGSTVAFAGMNLPMAITAAMGLQTSELAELKANLMSEGKDGVKEFVIEAPADDEDEI